MPADIKVSGLPSDSSLDANHYVVLNDPTGPTTKRTPLSILAAFLFNQLNIPDGGGSPRTRMIETQFDFVASGLVWSGDAYNSTRNASMTAGVVYINGRRLTISAVAARSFTASKDTYIDILDNADGTYTLVYTEVTLNNPSPALAANSMRIGIIVTGATNILNVGSINQGEEDKVLPLASSIAYTTTDSLGNLICPRDPQRRVLGYRQITSTFSTASTSNVQVDGLTCPVKVPTGRKVKITAYTPQLTESATPKNAYLSVWDGAVGVGTALQQGVGLNNTAANGNAMIVPIVKTASGSKTYNVGTAADSASTISVNAAATSPSYILVELV